MVWLIPLAERKITLDRIFGVFEGEITVNKRYKSIKDFRSDKQEDRVTIFLTRRRSERTLFSQASVTVVKYLVTNGHYSYLFHDIYICQAILNLDIT